MVTARGAKWVDSYNESHYSYRALCAPMQSK